jgi:hypothetical protein
MAFSESAGALVLFGGVGDTLGVCAASGGTCDDTWLWSAGAWAKATTVSSPTPRSRAGLADAAGGLTLYGGTPFTDETYVFDPLVPTWTKTCGTGTTCAAPLGRRP